MTDYTIIDRRVNPKGKNLANRQRFINRAKGWIKKKVLEKSTKRSITSKDGEDISISSTGIEEPNFDYDHNTGSWDRVLPGNKEYIPGDKIKRPQGGAGNRGRDAGDGDGEDSFKFTITKDEYLNILFEDLELPDMIKESEAASVSFRRSRSGFSTSGTPNNLDIERSAKNALGRRIALIFPLNQKIKDLEEQVARCPDLDLVKSLNLEIEELSRRRDSIAYFDDLDIRYRRYNKVPVPTTQAVVFCLMDVSASMEEKEKEIAKRFFLLLYLFLERKYQRIEIRFVRHTTDAEECTEEEFFYDRKTGGTIVSAGIKKVHELIKSDYDLDKWNVYVVQASDGDNSMYDNETVKEELAELLPKCQYYIYHEVKPGRESSHTGEILGHSSTVYDTISKLRFTYPNIHPILVGSIEDVVPIFRKIFTKTNEK